MSVLAERQLRLNQSVILDSVAGAQSIRGRWLQLADQYTAGWRVIECVCSDEALHRARLSERQRGIPGWYELEWSDIEKAKRTYIPWVGERLVLDMVRPLEENLSEARAFVRYNTKLSDKFSRRKP